MMNFNTSNQSYRQLMGNGLIYSVPRFQRDYSWTDQEWDDLWQDILNVVELKEDPAHYMGYLVLQSNDSKNFDIIDGQQRLTTLSLLIIAVLSLLNEFIEKGIAPEKNKQRLDQLRNSFIGYLDPVSLVPRSKLNLNRNNDSLFQNYLVPLVKAPKRNLKATEHLMRKAFEWFKDKISKKYAARNDGAELARLIDQLVDKLFFTVITVTDQLNAYRVFETLNARGVKLSSTDLLKNHFFSVVHKEIEDENELYNLERRWEQLVGTMGSQSFPDFLRAHWNSKNKFVRHSELFKRIREKVSDRGEVFTLMREMEQDADVYAALANPEDELWSYEQKQYIGLLKMFGVRQLYPLLLAAYRTFPEQEMVSLLRALTIISFRYNVIGSLAAGEQERVYNAIAFQLSTNKIEGVGQTIKALATIYPSDQQFATAFSEKVLRTNQSRKKRIVKYILFSIESHLSGTNFDFDSSSYNIEHILPENPQEGWGQFSDNEHRQSVYRLGNMIPLNASVNRDIGNLDFAAKKAAFAKSEFEVSQRIATENDAWNPERIAQHQRWMARQATAIWRIAQLG